MATHLEDFLELSCGELQFYLKQRGLPSGGTHSDLAARALVAFEHKTPIRDSAESQAKSLQNEHVELLRTYGIKDPLSMFDWEDCVTKWPHTNIGQIFSFILGKKAFDTDYIGQYKIRKAYSYFKSGFVHTVYSKTIHGQDKVLLFASVTPSQRIREEPHKVWIICKSPGEILGAYCSCTAGYSQCCNHVIALLYKVEFANQKGFTDPSCTDKACVWNNTSKKDIQPMKLKDMVFQSHKVVKENPSYAINSKEKQNFDPRPESLRVVTEESKQKFLASLRNINPDAVIHISYAPPTSDDVPPSLQIIADDISSKNNGVDADELVRQFLEQLSFNDSSIKELEKATRDQANSSIWKEQRKGRITASHFHEVYTKTKTILRKRKPNCKVTPLLERILDCTDLSMIPAIKWGREHERDAAASFFAQESKKHKNAKLQTCGLFISKTYPFVGATPDGIFHCDCCGHSCIEYKCPYSLADMKFDEHWNNTTYLELVNGNIMLKRTHSYYYQIQGQMALTGCPKTFFVVWTPLSGAHIEIIEFDLKLWQDIIPNLTIFFKTYVARVLLGTRPIYYCAVCEKPCLEPDEIECDDENSVQCECCMLWFHWACSNFEQESTFICRFCNEQAIDND